MIVQSLVNPVWVNADHTLISCTIKFGHLATAEHFVASPEDVEAHGRKIFADLVEGVYGPIGEYVEPEVLPEPTPAPAPAPAPVTKEALMRELEALSARIAALDSPAA